MNHVPFIAVEGPIGVGKSSLAEKISQHFHFHLLKEIVGENPFLSKFYEDMDEWSFQTEMFFLCNRIKQLEDIQKNCLQKGIPVVSDYHMFKNLIFAKRTLDRDHLDKYIRIFHILNENLPRPNMVIYLHANLDTLFSRIAKRGREYEKHIQESYLKHLCDDYEMYMDKFERENPDLPVLRINGDDLDFVENRKDLEKVLNQVENMLYKGADKQ
ncbi:deoxynucleoside kinase [Caldibacillus debilis]|jgi:deoxyguanosine kinase|uniref:Deoxynucleoside kinase n=1 Tax=Caldibacillus debilis GB1 TaxID=1339248 RepID=A0A420VFE0_9BACI|nr:deoxynucleoside kinase [Caldibacillus debilis]MBO2481467.1 deoxynucleoside kinase [Bacillaceae bacterium]MBY6270851.1 deoxynucleoside kinase [Bacillaceae bacterium]REJ25165.1 MAG: deoxynucleoside kinase [Caldibacillus debilis]RKO62402.1 Deoxynucleoside kinase [Caldibacillus debilis GB1]